MHRLARALIGEKNSRQRRPVVPRIAQTRRLSALLEITPYYG
jgi:hypothetical protein